MSANPVITIDPAARHAGVRERSVERAGRSDFGSFLVAALFAAVVVPAMTGWLYLLAVTFWKIMNWMIV
jgi:cytochrome b